MQLRDVVITVDDGTMLHARVHDGHSPALILLHDLDCSSTYWDAVVARLLALDPDLHVIALDMRGHGRSTCSGETSRKRLVKDVRQVCKQLDLDAPVLCGHGWGADVALASESAGSVIAINPLFGRPPGPFSEDVLRPVGMGGATSAELLASCRFGIEHSKRLRRSRREAPLLLLAADPADTEAEAYPEIADAALEAYAWQEASRHLPLEAPAGIAALVLSWIEEVA